jgi:hypothetical protein
MASLFSDDPDTDGCETTFHLALPFSGKQTKACSFPQTVKDELHEREGKSVDGRVRTGDLLRVKQT